MRDNTRDHRRAPYRRRPLIVAGVLLGMGLGGFIDGILLHQVLQWHHMVTSAGYPATTLGNLVINTFWDGVFHVLTWVLTALGLALLWRAGRRADVPWSTRTFVGSLLGGWGLFNVVEGIIDHHLLGLHHVREGPGQLAYDLGYLGLGAGLIVVGWYLVQSAPRPAVVAQVEEERLRRAG